MADADKEIIIIGGGPVGCVAALALEREGFYPTIIEAQSRKDVAPEGRTLALSWNSYLILNQIDCWPEELETYPIQKIDISDKGNFGSASVRAEEIQVPSLGFAVRFRDLLDVLRSKVDASSVRINYDSTATSIQRLSDGVKISLQSNGQSQQHDVRLVIMADGGRSLDIAGLSLKKTIDRDHDAIVGLVTASAPPTDIAYERFTSSGPIALLPRGNKYSFVWSVPRNSSDKLLHLSDDAFLKEFQTTFGRRCGQFQHVEARMSYPLSTRIAEQPGGGGIISIGNASQALHPVAAQGLNLGLRDAWELGQFCAETSPELLPTSSFTKNFIKKRRVDRFTTTTLSTALDHLFSNKLFGLSGPRGLGLLGLDIISPLKKRIFRKFIFGARG